MKSVPPQFPLFYLAFTERGQVITPGQHVIDTRNAVCQHAGDSGETSYLVVQTALKKDGLALFLSTAYEDLIGMSV